MAAVVPGPGFDPAALHRHLAERLPAYARPVFLRLRDRVDTTETFKPKTAALAREGFDPGSIADPLYVGDAGRGAYVPLDATLHGWIVRGEARV